MLHSYAFSNFRSFRARVDVPLTLADNATVNGWVRTNESGQRLTTALAIFGANASGKTSLIQPLAFLGWFIGSSFKAEPKSAIPISPHFTGKDDSTHFEAVADGLEPESLLRYRLEVTTAHVVTESLEKRVRRGRWKAVFDRKRLDDDKYEVVQDGFGLDPAQAALVRPNVSLVSWAAQFGVELAKRISNFHFPHNMNAAGRQWQPQSQSVDAYAQFYAENEPIRLRMRNLLRKWDLGLTDVRIEERSFPDANGEIKKYWFPVGVHEDKDQTKHELPFIQESSGTKSAFALLAPILGILQTGIEGVVAWDELESDLHPHMMAPLLELFSDPETNPKNVQIVFTCHAPEVMKLLQKSQLMLVVKDGLESEAWRLDSKEGVRSDDNRAAKYLLGDYGAVPRIKS